VPGSARTVCTAASEEGDHCTVCTPTQLSLRWVMPDLNGTGELEVGCFEKAALAGTTLIVDDQTNKQIACASVSDAGVLRVGLPASQGDKVKLFFYAGKDQVDSYGTCNP